MGVFSDLIVAPLRDAASIADVAPTRRSWTWRPFGKYDPSDVACIYCLADGHAPCDPVDPPRWMTNPFTKKKQPVLLVADYIARFELVSDEDSEIVVMRLPPIFVGQLAAKTASDLATLAESWAREASNSDWTARNATGFSESVAVLHAMAMLATERSEELFLWTSP